ncbi:Beta-galactosidase C-terminal domain [Paenibacillus sp. FSL K6-0276]|uniref:Beta-galactosidase C-terminal domain n=2 Tax=unclassified Paenibacillus TaxID=185978 RepID=UPI0030EBA795
MRSTSFVTRNHRGKGEVWYQGAVFNEQAASKIIDQIGLKSPADWIDLPEEMEFQIRNGASSSYTFVLNYSETPASIHLHETKTDLLSGKTLSGEVTLEGFGVLILH